MRKAKIHNKFREVPGQHGTPVTLTLLPTLAILEVVKKSAKSGKTPRPPRIRVPNNERAIFTIDSVRVVGVLQRVSLTGGSAVLSKGPIAHGTRDDMDMKTVFGRVNAQIEFLQTGADGVPLAQAFRFLNLGATSARRFAAAAKQMQKEGYSDAPPAGFNLPAAETLGQLLHSVRRLAANMVAIRTQPQAVALNKANR